MDSDEDQDVDYRIQHPPLIILEEPPKQLKTILKLPQENPTETIHEENTIPTATSTPLPKPKTIRIHQNKQPKEPQEINQTTIQDEKTEESETEEEIRIQINQLAANLTNDEITNEECVPIFSSICLKKKRKMLYAPMDFKETTMDALIESGALINCMSEKDLKEN